VQLHPTVVVRIGVGTDVTGDEIPQGQKGADDVTGERQDIRWRAEFDSELLLVHADVRGGAAGCASADVERFSVVVGCVADRVAGLGDRVEKLGVGGAQTLAVSLGDVAAPVKAIRGCGAEDAYDGA
jgi:hypothetical protein